MKHALIGHSGFVGGNLDRQAQFTHRFNTTNIDALPGQHFDLVVCAGAPAEKWKANADPANDRARLSVLEQALLGCTADRVILISTIDVYPEPADVDEATEIDPDQSAPYGRHRYELEQKIANHFDTMVVRLPGLFGSGLKKNAIYDLLHDNQVERLNADNVYQFYHLDSLWRDVQTADEKGLKLINLVTEPVSLAEVAHESFGMEFNNRPGPQNAAYDVHTLNAALYQGDGNYISPKRDVLSAISGYVQAERAS